MERARIILVEDHRPFQEFCKELLEPEFELVRTLDGGERLLPEIAATQPAAVILDFTLPVKNGLELTREVAEYFPSVKIAVWSAIHEQMYADEVIAAGASAYVLKWSAAKDLLPAIREILAGRTFVSDPIAGEGSNSKR